MDPNPNTMQEHELRSEALTALQRPNARINEQALWTYPELAGLAIESLESNHIEITTFDSEF